MHKRPTLIAKFFGMTAKEAIAEIRQLSEQDKSQLASAIARSMGITEEQCDFQFVPY